MLIYLFYMFCSSAQLIRGYSGWREGRRYSSGGLYGVGLSNWIPWHSDALVSLPVFCCCQKKKKMGDRYDKGRVFILGEGYSLRHIIKAGSWKRNQDRKLIKHRAESKWSSQFLNWQVTHLYEVKVAQSCLTLWPHGLYRPWNSPGQNTGVGCLSFLQGIFPT